MSGDKDLERFRAWLTKRGRSYATAELYVSCLRRAMECHSLIDRLVEPGLSPASKRALMAALRAWASFKNDAALKAELNDIRLPANARVSVKTPLELPQWKRLAEAVSSSRAMPDAVKCCLMLLCDRGLRAGDVLRLSRGSIAEALRTGVLVVHAKGGRMQQFGAKGLRVWLTRLSSMPGPWRHVWELVSPHASRPAHTARQRLGRWLKRAARDAGLPPRHVHCHRLRRTYAVAFYEETGHDIMALQNHMQWANVETTARYIDHDRSHKLDDIAQRMRKRRAELHG